MYFLSCEEIKTFIIHHYQVVALRVLISRSPIPLFCDRGRAGNARFVPLPLFGKGARAPCWDSSGTQKDAEVGERMHSTNCCFEAYS